MPTITDKRTVPIPKTCGQCGQEFVIECEHTSGFGYMPTYCIDCPRCRHISHPVLPADVVDIWTRADWEAR